MVETTAFAHLTDHGEVLRHYDKNTFILQAQSHGLALPGILCEQGESFM